MKRFLSLLLSIFLLVPSFAPTVSAVSANYEESATLYYEDGSFLTITTQMTRSRSSDSVLGTRTFLYRSSDGVVQWQAVLRGLFRYDGTTSNCTSSVCDVTIYNSDWYTISKNVRTSGNSALADLTMGRTLLGGKVEQRTVNMSLSCDVNGNLY